MSDPSAEAERLTQQLRAAGYQVVDVPMSLLLARVAVQRPRLIVLDADADGAAEAVAKLREAEAAEPLDIVLLGRAAPSGEEPQAEGFFARPVDTVAIVRRVEQLTGRADAEPKSRSAPPASPSAPGPGRLPPLSLREPHSSHPPGSSAGSGASAPPPPPLSGRPPGMSQETPGSQRPGRVSIQTALSDELELLLLDAEQRVGTQVGREAALPTPEEELEAVLPAELLAALDEPLEEDDDEFSGDAVGRAGVSADRPNVSSVTNSGRELTPAPSEAQPARTQAAYPQGSAPVRRPTGRPSALSVAASAAAEATTHAGSAAASFGPAISPPPTAAPSMPQDSEPMAGPPTAMVSHADLPRRDEPRLPRATSVPSVLGPGDAPRVLARAIAARASGALCFESQEGLRRVVLRDGDLVTAASSVDDETLLAFMTTRGDLRREQVRELLGKVPPFGRHAGAALVAHGLLRQDQLWPVLRAHAEWLVGRALVVTRGTARLEAEPPGRLRQEPSVFGGSTGAEVIVEVTRRTVSPEESIQRLGGLDARVREGEQASLLSECALEPAERSLIDQSRGLSVDELVQGGPGADMATVLYVLSLLGVVAVARDDSPSRMTREDSADDASDVLALDLSAIRERVRARMNLVGEADYFTLLGISRDATGYEIRRAFAELRRSFEPSTLLTPELADLADDVRTIIVILEEAYEILRDTARRERYRRALGDPPA